MSGVAIYMEGGGLGKGSRSALRRGMDGFLHKVKGAAQAKACFDVVGRMIEAA